MERLAAAMVAVVLVGGALLGCRRPPTSPWTNHDAGPRADGSGPDGGGPGGGGEGPTSCVLDADDSFCMPYATAFCAAHFACCEDLDYQYTSMAACLDEQACLCASSRTGSAFASGLVTFDEGAASALLARLRDQAETCEGLSFGETDAASAFEGTLGEGADCSPTATDYSTLYACAPGLFCEALEATEETTVTRAECHRYAAIGDVCNGAECAPGSHCAAPSLDEAGTCIENAPTGAPCVEDTDCASELCDEVSLTCAPIDPHDTWCTEGPITETE